MKFVLTDAKNEKCENNKMYIGGKNKNKIQVRSNNWCFS